MNIVIDATNLGGGGGVTHLKEILRAGELPCQTIVIAQQKILKQLDDKGFLVKTGHPLLEKSLLHRVFFQMFRFDSHIPENSIVFSITGDYLGNHRPVVSMSQNMLLYERDIWKEIKNVREVMRFLINFQKQKRSFSQSEGIIFISRYAKNFISQKLDLSGKKIMVIHHGIAKRFFREVKEQLPIAAYSFSNPFRFTYVSTVHVYKNQWNVVEAIGMLRKMGYPVELTLVGGVIFSPAGKRLEQTILKTDPGGEFIHTAGDVPYSEIDRVYNSCDGIIFASTCENMPNILIESMASGVPVACSNKQPMPEFLKESGFYFDAHNIDSIVSTLVEMLDYPRKRAQNAADAIAEAARYSWADCSRQTFEFLTDIHNNFKHRL